MGNADLVEAVKAAPSTAPIPHKLRALLRIAGQVARVGRSVAADDIASARRLGATDVEIHDAVFVAAAFCMFNLCVDGLAALTPDDPRGYAARGRRLAEKGYVQGPPTPGAGSR